MISKDKQYRTRDGREVRIYATDGGGPYMVHGAIRLPNFWSPTNWDENGLYKAGGFVLHDYDLIEIRPRHKRTVWVNVYPEQIHGWFNTRQEAQEFARRNLFVEKTVGDTDYLQWKDKRIACIKVDLDFEEGEGL